MYICKLKKGGRYLERWVLDYYPAPPPPHQPQPETGKIESRNRST